MGVDGAGHKPSAVEVEDHMIGGSIRRDDPCRWNMVNEKFFKTDGGIRLEMLCVLFEKPAVLVWIVKILS